MVLSCRVQKAYSCSLFASFDMQNECEEGFGGCCEVSWDLCRVVTRFLVE
jgi:hypothetical protein